MNGDDIFDLANQTGGGGTETKRYLSELLGQTVYDMDTNRPYKVIRYKAGSRWGGYILEDMETGQRVFPANKNLVDSFGVGYSIGSGGDTETGPPMTARNLPQWMLQGSGGSTGSAPSYMSTQPAQTAQFAHDQAMANLQAQLAEAASVGDYDRQRELELEILGLQQDFQAKQQAKAEKATLQRERLGVLQNLVEGFMQSQQRASEFVLQMQPDPFRFAAAAQGMPVMGTTPQEGYAEALTEFAQRPVPSMDPNAPLSAIEGGIESIMGQRFPLQPGLFGGMSGGGTVPMGASGTYLVGEKGPEVMDVSPVGVTVRPLSGGFADGGGVSFGEVRGASRRSKIDPALVPGLAPLYAALGLEQIPTMTRAPASSPRAGLMNVRGWSDMPGRELYETLGIRPQLIRDRSTGTTYYIENGTMRKIPSAKAFEDMGFRWSDVFNMNPDTIADYGWGMGAPMQQAPQMRLGAPGPMTTMGFPAIEPTTGAVLPSPMATAYDMRRLSAANPDLYNIATSAYDYPNSPVMPGAFQTAMETYLPRGTPQRLTGLR